VLHTWLCASPANALLQTAVDAAIQKLQDLKLELDAKTKVRAAHCMGAQCNGAQRSSSEPARCCCAH
jgi:hypothetical protein